MELYVFPFAVGRRGSVTNATELSGGRGRVRRGCGGGERGTRRRVSGLCRGRNMGPANNYLAVVIPFLILFKMFCTITCPLAGALRVSDTGMARTLGCMGAVPKCATTSNTAGTACRRVCFLGSFDYFRGVSTVRRVFSTSRLGAVAVFRGKFGAFNVGLFTVPRSCNL